MGVTGAYSGTQGVCTGRTGGDRVYMGLVQWHTRDVQWVIVKTQWVTGEEMGFH